MDVFLGIGIALAGYFIGEGLKQRNQTKGSEQNDILLIKERIFTFTSDYF